MKSLILQIFCFPIIILIPYLMGLLTSKLKVKLRFYSLALFILLIFSLPITSIIISYPLTAFKKDASEESLSKISAVFVLTGGIRKNVINEWIPSETSLNRTLIANKIANDLALPLIISGGKTSSKEISEALVLRNHLMLYSSILEEESLNTFQSAINLKPLCSKYKENILLVTSNLHSIRAYLTFKTQKCNVLTYNYKNKSEKIFLTLSSYMPSLNSLSEMNAIIYEYFAIFYYIITNKINIFNFTFLKL